MQLYPGIYTRDRLYVSYLKIIIIIATLISCSHQTTLAEYSFPDIAATTVLSSVNPSTQPQIKFPSVLNSANTANNPAVSSHGIEITPQKYIVIDSPWIQTADVCTEVNFWLYWRAGVLGQFGAVSVQNLNGISKYIELKAEGTTSSLNFNVYYGGQTISVGKFKQGWHVIAFGLCSDFLGTNIYKPSVNGYALSSYVPGIGNYISTNPLYIGCMTCTDSNANYIIHSIRVLNTNSSTVFNPFSNAVFNAFSYCGDGAINGTDSCDDLNLVSGDGCSDICAIESGYRCGFYTSGSFQICDLCGNGQKFLSESCDDGNTVNGDGCSSNCYQEAGWFCSGNLMALSTCTEYCGDGRKYSTVSTACDDYNTINGDGCSSACVIDDGNIVSDDGCSSTCVKETGWDCSGGSSTSKDVCTDVCGDGKKYTALSTFCDDGNANNDDGCSSTCTIETGWICTGGSPTTKDACSENCGDGIRFNSNSTYCDDGNKISGDGCSSACVNEAGWVCSGGSTTSNDICTEICGDGKRYNALTTYCDDGNSLNGDGCSLSCTIESGWVCSGGSLTTKDVCTEVCGDGMKFNVISTYCDDGNSISGDGCSSSCNIESGYSCSGGTSLSKDTCSDLCGDGKRFSSLSTYCDDGNIINGDGCSSTCAIESGWQCSGGSTSTKDTCVEICGDGKRYNSISTYCDDGNASNNDGCSSTCSVESGYTCSGGSSTNKDTCIELCGDGKRFNSISTYCDDSNAINGDGCSSSCSIEAGWICSGGTSSTKDICTEICGDGKRFNSISTYCDDGNNVNGDGCNSVCNVETYWTCFGGSSISKDTCIELCGDGKRFNSIVTYCDDGNTNNNDGCSSSCNIETGWVCSGGSSSTIDICSEICGDGKRFTSLSTYCDDGNTSNGDGCNSTCVKESGWNCSGGSSAAKDVCTEICGDGIRFNSVSSYCDDGNSINGDGCSTSCSKETGWICSGGSLTSKDSCTEICGDGKRFNAILTYCDDGNLLNGDGCDSLCGIEAGWTCSGGTSSLPDSCYDICGDGIKYGSLSTKCDDANKINGDGCNALCNVETGWNCSGGTPTSADTCTEICGDGIRFNSISTYCDDGNLANGDGCSSTCVKETGWVCGGGSSTSKDICNDVCGDGKKYSSAINFCDDENTSSNDGCSSICIIETGWTCTGGTTTNKDTCTEICGDGIRFNSISTYCDDGNLSSNDGCNSSCQIETGWTCFGGTPSNKDACNDLCGDGKKYSSLSTFCDDGNKLSGDGCSSSCFIESGWTCTGGTTTNKDTCTEICGDGIRFNSISAYCDDGNLVNNDGCDSSCNVETGQSCSGGNSFTKDTCTEKCGDGLKFSTLATFCDDGNNINGDGCDSVCNIESGWTCSGGSKTSKDTCTEICGDGVKFNTKFSYCDDGNKISGDGCSSSCSVETGFICSGGSNVGKDTCEICGDGIKSFLTNNYCDDGNTLNNDGCSSICSIEKGWSCSGGTLTNKDTCDEICGDGIKFNTNSSYCDDGNLIDGDGCSSICSVEQNYVCVGGSSKSMDTCDICGDGKHSISTNTFCDDGNLISNDGCSSTCIVESGWICSGGTYSSRDICIEICGDGKRFNSYTSYCDDGNIVNNDGCNSICGVESGYKCTGGDSSSKDVCSVVLDSTSVSGSVTISTKSAATTQSTAAVGIGASAGTSLLSMSSPAAIFMMINQFQMLLLLPLTGAYISDQVLSTITGMSITLFKFDFIKIDKYFEFIYSFYEYLAIAQSNASLSQIGINSGNVILNNFKLFIFFTLLILLHICLLPCFAYCRKSSKVNCCTKLFNFIYKVMTFAIYVRLILQAYLLLLLSSISSIYDFNYSTTVEKISLCISFFIFLMIILILLLCICQIRKFSEAKNYEYLYFKEFFNGLKENTKSRCFVAIFILQRILYATILITLPNFNYGVKIAFITIIQLGVVLYCIIVRPYDQVKDSIMEIYGQIALTFFFCILFFYKVESRWTSTTSWLFIGPIMFSSLLSTALSIIDLIINLNEKYKSKCVKKERIENYRRYQPNYITNQDEGFSDNRNNLSQLEESKYNVSGHPSDSSPSFSNIKISKQHTTEQRVPRVVVVDMGD